MPRFSSLPAYDFRETYEWNYVHAPDPMEWDVPKMPGRWQFCGQDVASPLGIAAGPLLNGQWCLYYASLGFDVLTYKTVRSRERASYPLPNLQPIVEHNVGRAGQLVGASEAMLGSWAVSFGMPSKAPEVWRADVEKTRRRLPPGKLLVVSVVASEEPGWSIHDIARDYALCARWAIDSGADGVELNLSCPNVITRDGQLFQDVRQAMAVVSSVRESIGAAPLILKTGQFVFADDASEFVDSLIEQVDGFSTVNCISARVSNAVGQPMFDGQSRGIAGLAIRQESLRQVNLLSQRCAMFEPSRTLISVGGISTFDDMVSSFANGATAVQIATAAMRDPLVGIRIKTDSIAHL